MFWPIITITWLLPFNPLSLGSLSLTFTSRIIQQDSNMRNSLLWTKYSVKARTTDQKKNHGSRLTLSLKVQTLYSSSIAVLQINPRLTGLKQLALVFSQLLWVRYFVVLTQEWECSQDADWNYKAWLGLENLVPRWRTHLAVGKMPQFPAPWASLLGCLKILTTWQLVSPEWVI